MSAELLDRASQYLRDEVAPHAERMDTDVAALQVALAGLCQREMMALRRPDEFGGPALAEADFRAFQLEVARYSGALAFLQTQHQSAVSMIAKNGHQALQERVLPRMANGDLLMGIGFSQLRRAGPPILRAAPIDGGYVVNGELPWLTGLGFFHEVLVGASLPDGRALFFATSFTSRPELQLSEPMRLAAMEAAQTVSGIATGLFVPEAEVAFMQAPEWIHRNDLVNVTLQGFFALGCARGALDQVEKAAVKKGSAVTAAAAQLLAEWEACLNDLANPPAEFEEKLKTRAWAIELCGRCAQAAIAATGGSGIVLTHPAQRLAREATVYAVSAQTPAIMEATLARITARTGTFGT